jgi:hypothetical protein
MINRDDWLSPAAFVARIDLDAKPVDNVVVRVQRHSAENAQYLPRKVLTVREKTPLFVNAAAIIDGSHQSGSHIVVKSLEKPMRVGTVFTIEGVTWYSLQWDENKSREFIVVSAAEIGHTVIALYPPIEAPRTVNHLPMNGSIVTIKHEATDDLAAHAKAADAASMIDGWNRMRLRVRHPDGTETLLPPMPNGSDDRYNRISLRKISVSEDWMPC